MSSKNSGRNAESLDFANAVALVCNGKLMQMNYGRQDLPHTEPSKSKEGVIPSIERQFGHSEQ